MTDSSIDVEFGDEQIVRVVGCVELSNREEFAAALASALETGGKVVVDLSRADSLDSGALSCLFHTHRQARDAGAEIALAGASSRIRRILQMSGLGPALGLALVEIRGGQPDVGPDLRGQDWQITESVVLAEPELLPPLRDQAVHAAREAGLAPESVADVQLAVTEALENALVHGSPAGAQSKIRLRCLACPRAYVVEVVDEGPGVSAEAAQRSNASDDGSALGLRLMQSAMDVVEFFQDERGGRVRMLKWVRPEQNRLFEVDD